MENVPFWLPRNPQSTLKLLFGLNKQTAPHEYLIESRLKTLAQKNGAGPVERWPPFPAVTQTLNERNTSLDDTKTFTRP